MSDVFDSFDAEAFGLPTKESMPDEVDTGTAVPDALADDIDDYAEHAERRDAHLTQDDADPDADSLPEQEEPTQRGDKTVPLGALQEERNLRKQAQDRERELQEQVAQLQAFQQQVQAYLAQQQQVQIPIFEDDPQGHVEAVQAQMQQQLQAVQQQVALQQFSQQLQQEFTAAAPTIIASEAAIAEEVGQDNYHRAFVHVHQNVQARLQQMYPGANAEQLAMAEKIATVAFVRDCQAQGLDPATHIYNKAMEFGFVPSGQRVPNQKRKAPPTSLSTVPAAGRAPDQRGRLTAKDIASMPQDEPGTT